MRLELLYLNCLIVCDRKRVTSTATSTIRLVSTSAHWQRSAAVIGTPQSSTVPNTLTTELLEYFELTERIVANEPILFAARSAMLIARNRISFWTTTSSKKTTYQSQSVRTSLKFHQFRRGQQLREWRNNRRETNVRGSYRVTRHTMSVDNTSISTTFSTAVYSIFWWARC